MLTKLIEKQKSLVKADKQNPKHNLRIREKEAVLLPIRMYHWPNNGEYIFLGIKTIIQNIRFPYQKYVGSIPFMKRSFKKSRLFSVHDTPIE